MKSKCALYISFSLLLLLYCGKSDQTYTIEIKDGVRHVHNNEPLWGDTLKVELKFLQKIGNLDSDDDNYILYRPFEVVRDGEGNIYIVDGGNNRLQKFNADGQYIMTIGRQGQGPGEFSNPNNINIDLKSNIYVNDEGNNRIQIFSSEGKYISSIRPDKWIFHLRLQKSGNLVVRTLYAFLPELNRSEKDFEPKLMAFFDSEGKFLKRFGNINKFEDNLISQEGNTITFETDTEDNIYVSLWRQNRIDKYSPDGTLLFTIDRKLNYDLNYKKRIIKLPDPADPSKTLEIPDVVFTSVSSKGLGIDYKGRLWIPTFQRQPDKTNPEDEKTATDLVVLEIYDREGILLARLPNDFFFKRFRIFGDLVYFIDNYYEMCVYEYKIIEK